MEISMLNRRDKSVVAILGFIFCTQVWSGGPQPGASPAHVIFVLDTSLSLEKHHAHHVKLVKQILEGPFIKHFNALTFDSAGRWLEPKGWLDNNEANRKKTIKVLEDAWLEGASDIGAALDALSRPSFAVDKAMPVRVYFYSR